jgi:hypothetical protein
MTISVYNNIAKAPMGWTVYCDGVKIGGVFGSKAAAFEAATVAASFAVQGGSGVQLNVADALRSDEIPSEWIAAIK